MELVPDEVLANCFARLSPPEQALARLVCRRFYSILSTDAALQLRKWQGLLEPWLCVMGGVQEHHHEPMVELYDFLADKWRVMLPNPPTITFDFCCAVVKERLYKLGGFMGFLDFNVDKVPLMDVYNFRKHTWEKGRQMDEMREAFACGVINDRIYVAGGLVRKPFLQENLRVRSAEVYIPETDSWESIPAMKECRSCCASAVVGQKLYVIGGYGTDSILRSVEVFDPAIKTWEFRAQTPASWIIAGCAAIGHLIYFVVSSALEMEAVAVYDTQTDEWYVKGVIPLESLLNGSKGSLWGCTVLASKGKLYVLGGASSCSSGGLKCGLVYDPTLETWSPLKMMRSRRHGCAGVVIYL
ncbi:hypothetical protein O6H91_05G019300 [Diphasiastrum complanatum]|uniref:Uncharacterized protein n=1 Tax=Diphasiastrum complanatum TaxID=34168 RepID=A0ACC2DLD4_DIPCM|nr:hypothetical protein O6H91_05G019300 [Diphasiastrum complanatum]